MSLEITVTNRAEVFVRVGTLEEPKPEAYEQIGSDPEKSVYASEESEYGCEESNLMEADPEGSELYRYKPGDYQPEEYEPDKYESDKYEPDGYEPIKYELDKPVAT